MRIKVVREIFLKELREALRDRRSLMALFGVPLFLYPLMFYGFGMMAASNDKKRTDATYSVVVTNAADSPQLCDVLNAPGSGLHVVTVSRADVALRSGGVSAVLEAPPHYEADLVGGKAPTLHIDVDRSKQTTGAVEDKIGSALKAYEESVIARRLDQHGLPATIAAPILSQTDDVESTSARLAQLLSTVMPMLLMLTGLVAALSTALVATTSEREAGSMESLLVTPVRKVELLAGKALLVYLAAVFAMASNLASMSLVLWRTTRSAPHGEHVQLDPGALGLALVAVLPTLLFLSAMCLVIGLAARNYREAGSYAQFPVLAATIPVAASMSQPDTKASLAVLATPIVNSSVVMRHVLLGHFTAGEFWTAAFFSILWAVLMLAAAARLFNSEQLVNADWEPLAMMRGKGRPRKPRMPAIEEGLFMVAISLLLTFYFVPEWTNFSLVDMTARQEIALMAAPALLMARLFNYRRRETFSLRIPSVPQAIGGLIIGVGAVPVVGLLKRLQDSVWAPDATVEKAVQQMMGPALVHNGFETALILGALAGVCEELLFRGPLLQSMLRKMPVWGALLASGAVFAAVHMDLHGMIIRTLLGTMLGWIVVRTGSIVPAMLAHFAFDSSTLAIATYDIHRYGLDRAFSAGVTRQYLPVEVVVGVGLLLIGYRVLMSRAPATDLIALEHEPEPEVVGVSTSR